MKKTKFRGKLSLNKHAVAKLNVAEMSHIQGGEQVVLSCILKWCRTITRTSSNCQTTL